LYVVLTRIFSGGALLRIHVRGMHFYGPALTTVPVLKAVLLKQDGYLSDQTFDHADRCLPGRVGAPRTGDRIVPVNGGPFPEFLERR
jgi:hypothetical protein